MRISDWSSDVCSSDLSISRSIISLQKESVMAKKPATKSKTTKSKTTKSAAAKKSAPSVKATPADVNDRQHLNEVIQYGTGCTGVAARETMSALLNTITASLKKNPRVQDRKSLK